MADYSTMTNEDFDRILIEILRDEPIENLLQIGTVYNDLAEEFNNAVLDAWTAEQEVDADWAAMKRQEGTA